ncbi:hypothetical protein L218DRAFT_611874 [Marasmius fiardii PR-910]|nr:hypothetical protein L218DRAFT_611874 [Marasmius fiardii PR-910]
MMFLIATAHIGVNFHRHRTALREGEIMDENTYDQSTFGYQMAKLMLLMIQEILGCLAATYRTWIVWNQDCKYVVLPLFFILAEIVVGSIVYSRSAKAPSPTVYDRQLDLSLKAYCPLVILTNITTTSLIAIRIWRTQAMSSEFFAMIVPSTLVPVLRILLESALPQAVVEILLFGFYLAKMSATLVLMDTLVPLLAITFNAITIRGKLLAFRGQIKSSVAINPPTIGSLPMHRILGVNDASDTVTGGVDENDPAGQLRRLNAGIDQHLRMD